MPFDFRASLADLNESCATVQKRHMPEHKQSQNRDRWRGHKAFQFKLAWADGNVRKKGS